MVEGKERKEKKMNSVETPKGLLSDFHVEQNNEKIRAKYAVIKNEDNESHPTYQRYVSADKTCGRKKVIFVGMPIVLTRDQEEGEVEIEYRPERIIGF